VSQQDPVELPPPGGRLARSVAGGLLVLGGLVQLAAGIQIGRPATVVAGLVVAALGAGLALRGGRGTTVGADGVHDPTRLRNRSLPWSTLGTLLVLPAAAGRVRVLVERRDDPSSIPLRIASLKPADADELLPRIVAPAEANDVQVIDRR
jgi:hypothetical protein